MLSDSVVSIAHTRSNIHRFGGVMLSRKEEELKSTIILYNYIILCNLYTNPTQSANYEYSIS